MSIKKIFKKTTEITVDTISSISSGIYEGATTAEYRERQALNSKIRKRKDAINKWSWILFVGIEISLIIYFITLTGFKNLEFESFIKSRGIILLIPVLLLILINSFSGKIAKEAAFN